MNRVTSAPKGLRIRVMKRSRFGETWYLSPTQREGGVQPQVGGQGGLKGSRRNRRSTGGRRWGVVGGGGRREGGGTEWR